MTSSSFSPSLSLLEPSEDIDRRSPLQPQRRASRRQITEGRVKLARQARSLERAKKKREALQGYLDLLFLSLSFPSFSLSSSAHAHDPLLSPSLSCLIKPQQKQQPKGPRRVRQLQGRRVRPDRQGARGARARDHDRDGARRVRDGHAPLRARRLPRARRLREKHDYRSGADGWSYFGRLCN